MITTRRPFARGADDCVGRHDGPVAEGDRLAALQRTALRPERDAEGVGSGGVELAGPVGLVDGVPDRRHAVVHREDEDAIAVALERLARPHLDRLERIGDLAEHPAKVVEELAQPRRARTPSSGTSRPRSANVFRSPGQAERVVGVVVREEDLFEVGQPERRAHQLPLGALGAVEEQPVAAAPDEQRRRSTARGRRAGGRAEEDDVEVHGSDCRSRPRAIYGSTSR